MKVLILVLLVCAFANSNPAANSKDRHWIPRTPKVTPNKNADLFPAVAPSKNAPKTSGSSRAPGSCGPVPSISPAIVGGQEAVPHSSPWQVGLWIDYLYKCGGSLISDEWVLTAAHCTIGAYQIKVIMGVHNYTLDEPSKVSIYSIGSDIITHPDFISDTLTNDIALIHLPTPVTLSAEIQPICLPGYSDPDLGVGVPVKITGWGLTNAGSSTSDVLMEGTVTTINNTLCEYEYGDFVTSANLCTSTAGGITTCSGDSGGPLSIVSGGQTVLRGITSFFSSQYCDTERPDGFIRVTHFLEWIESVTGITIHN